MTQQIAEYLAEKYPPLQRYWPNLQSVSAPQAAFLVLDDFEAFYGGAAGGGKLLGLDTKVPTPLGWTTIGELRPGDIVFGSDGSPTLVLAHSKTETPITYRLVLDDGSEFLACEDHRWLTFDSRELGALTRRDPEWRKKRRQRRPSRATSVVGGRGAGSGNHPHPELAERNRRITPPTKPAPTGSIRTTREIAETLLTPGGRTNHAIPVAGSLQLPERDLLLDPYLLGVWLGDGTSKASTITGLDYEIDDEFRRAGFEVKRYSSKTLAVRGLVTIIRSLGLFGNKHIPSEYLRGSAEQRLALLQGLMDSDGYCSETGKAEFTNTNELLAQGVRELIVSLGMRVGPVRESRATLNGRDCGPKYRLAWTPTMPVFRLHRKLVRQKVETRRTNRFRYIVSCERVSSVQMRCIRVAAEDGLFLAGSSMVPTHNSDALLAAALQYVDVPGYAALILRKSFRQLSLPDSIMSRSKEWLMPHRANGVKWNDDMKEWTFPSGATLTFGYLDHEDDVYNYQGPAFQFVGWDELTQFDQKPYKWLFSRTRRRKDLKELGIPIRHRSASNPGGVGHKWVHDRFITGDSLEPRERKSPPVFIPAKVDDNPGLDVDEYKESMSHLPETLQKQYLDGDWGVFEGAAFLISDLHEIPSFGLEDSHDRFEALDYGLNGAPWCLWATDYEGNVIAVDMGYWRDALPSDICPEVVEWRKRDWGLDNICYADPSLWKRTYGKNKWGAPAMLTDEFSDNGIVLTAANNDPRAGLARLRELLKLDPAHPFPEWHPLAGQTGSPRIFFTRACQDLVDELRAAPLQPIDQRDGGEIVDPKWEGKHGHAVAMARYAVMSKPEASEEPRREIEDTREAWIAEMHEKRDKELEQQKRRRPLLSYFT